MQTVEEKRLGETGDEKGRREGETDEYKMQQRIKQRRKERQSKGARRQKANARSKDAQGEIGDRGRGDRRERG